MTARTRKALRLVAVVFGVVLLALVLAYAAGIFPPRTRIEPGTLAPPRADAASAPAKEATALRIDVPMFYESVGTVESRATANVASRISAAVISVAVDAGAVVKEGQELAVLDDRELQARKRQAEGALAAAEAALREAERALEAAESQNVQAEANYKRVKGFRDEGVAAAADFEAAEAGFRQAQAGVARGKAAIERANAEVERARQGVREADVGLGFTRIVSPMVGEVARRLVDPGDLAWPGRTLVVVQDRRALRLRASVREGLWTQVGVGREVEVSIPAIEKSFRGKIEEIEPAADPRSRSFVVKVPVPAEEKLYPGMFGRLRIELGKRSAVAVPAAAIVPVGQLETVRVKSGDRWTLRYVRAGARLEGVVGTKELGESVEVLAGLEGGEVVGL